MDYLLRSRTFHHPSRNNSAHEMPSGAMRRLFLQDRPRHDEHVLKLFLKVEQNTSSGLFIALKFYLRNTAQTIKSPNCAQSSTAQGLKFSKQSGYVQASVHFYEAGTYSGGRKTSASQVTHVRQLSSSSFRLQQHS